MILGARRRRAAPRRRRQAVRRSSGVSGEWLRIGCPTGALGCGSEAVCPDAGQDAVRPRQVPSPGMARQGVLVVCPRFGPLERRSTTGAQGSELDELSSSGSREEAHANEGPNGCTMPAHHPIHRFAAFLILGSNALSQLRDGAEQNQAHVLLGIQNMHCGISHVSVCVCIA